MNADETLKTLRECGDCDTCSYYSCWIDEQTGDPADACDEGRLFRDIIALIESLQAKLDERNKECETQYELLAEKNQQLAASQRRERAAVECLERAMYTATTNHYDVEMCCMYCKYGPEGTCEGASTVLAGNPIDGQEYDWDCRRCSGVTVNDRGGWEFDYERWRSDVAGEGEKE